jgi:uncharacterized repeat protein (TIGR03843 family)
VTGWSPQDGPGLDAALVRLSTEELTVKGRLPWSSNLTFLVTVGDPTGDDDTDHDPRSGDRGTLRAVYKPASGEQSLWDFPDGLYQREVAAYLLSESLGWGLVPPTVVRDDGPFGPGSVQLFVEADYEQHYFTLYEEERHRPTLLAMCAFDIAANNADRKSGHVLEGTDGRLWGIDHGLCFHQQHKLRTVIWDFADEDVPDGRLADLAALADDLPDDLARLLSGAEREALVDRIRRLEGTGVFPEPRGDRPPYPWPLV